MRKLLTVLLAAAPLAAFAHPGHAVTGAVAGFVHPFSGADHLLAMLAVGLWAGRLGGQARWQLPLAFVATMVLGAVMGMAGLSLPGVETGIAASVMVLGLMLAFAATLPMVARLGLVAGFALLHGLAHGAELPVGAGALSYVAAFTVATAALHGIGLFAAARLPVRYQSALRWVGAAIALAGGGIVMA